MAMAADQTFENYRKPTRRDEFLKTSEAIVPWSALCEVTEPRRPKAANGRPPIGLEHMRRIHFIQHWFNLADLSCEESRYHSASLRSFVGIDLRREPVSDSTTITMFRKLRNDHKLGEALFAMVGQELQARGVKVNTGTIWAPKTSPTSAPVAPTASSVRWRAERTTTSPRFVLGWNTSLACSSGCGDLARCVIGVCRRTQRVRSRHGRWPIFPTIDPLPVASNPEEYATLDMFRKREKRNATDADLSCETTA